MNDDTQMTKKLIILIRVVKIISGVALVTGLLINFGLKTDVVKKNVLPLFPDYKLAQSGIVIFKDMRFPVNAADGNKILLGVLDIDQPSWTVFLRFIQSDIAFIKSERNKSTQVSFQNSDGSTNSYDDNKNKPLEPINWDRIKTISSGRIGTVNAGNKPLTPPYKLYVTWPAKTPRSVYEFYSFNEFEIDLESFLNRELEWYAAALSLISFFVGFIAVCLSRYFLHRFVSPKDQLL